MAIKLRPDQITKAWETIKYVVVTSNMNPVTKDRLSPFFNRLLSDLLSGSAQCFIRTDENEQLTGMAITKIREDKDANEKYLFVSFLFSFKSVSDEEWTKDINDLGEFAKSNGCSRIEAYSNSDRVFEITAKLGFLERYRCLVKPLED